MAYMNKSKSDDWLTPKDLYDDLNKEFGPFNFDPCPFPRPEWDGLKVPWGSYNFVNPPYKYLKEWIKKSYEESLKGKNIVLLIPARTDTKAFHKYIFPHAKIIRFLPGRIKFINGKNTDPAPFASVVVVFNR